MTCPQCSGERIEGRTCRRCCGTGVVPDVTGDCPRCQRGWVTDYMHGVCDRCIRRDELDRERLGAL